VHDILREPNLFVVGERPCAVKAAIPSPDMSRRGRSQTPDPRFLINCQDASRPRSNLKVASRHLAGKRTPLSYSTIAFGPPTPNAGPSRRHFGYAVIPLKKSALLSW